MSNFVGGLFGGGDRDRERRRERRERQAQQTKIDEENKKQKKKLAEEALVAQSKAKRKIQRQGARRSVITSPLGITDDTLA